MACWGQSASVSGMALGNASMLKHMAWHLCLAAAVLASGGPNDASSFSTSTSSSQAPTCSLQLQTSGESADDSRLALPSKRVALLQRTVDKHIASHGGTAEASEALEVLHGVEQHAAVSKRLSQAGMSQHSKVKEHAERSTTVAHRSMADAAGEKAAMHKESLNSSDLLHAVPAIVPQPQLHLKDIVEKPGTPKKGDKDGDMPAEVGLGDEPQHCRGDVKNNHSELSTVHGDDFLLPLCGTLEGKKHHGGGQSLLLLVPIFLAIGCLTSYFLRRRMASLPYTCMLFIEGFTLALAHRWITHGAWTSYDVAYSLFGSADPHLILYIFLPALIFGEAMSLNSNMVQACLPQCMLLAGPGALMGTCLIGFSAKYILPYGWDWPTAMLLGSILAATDPVAVVAIFKSVGVSPRLTMLISGESLLNDGVAIVLFQLFIEMSQGITPTAFGIVKFFTWMTTVAPLFGVTLGLLGIAALGHVSYHGVDLHGVHGDAMIQVITTFVCAYLSFFLAESELHTSGVLSLVATGMIMASYVWPRFNSRETLQDIWHVADFIGNTLIFMLAGLILGDIVASRTHIITWVDCFYLVVIYLVCMLARGIIMAILWIPLNSVGQRLTKEEAAVMVWSGLRGAVGLLMAVVADRTPGIDHETGTRLLFYVGGMAALMLIANGTLTPVVLQFCGFRETTNEQHAMKLEVQDRLAQKTRERLAQEASGEGKEVAYIFRGARLSQLPHIVQMLHDVTTESTSLPEMARKGNKNEAGLNSKLMELLRDTVRTMTKSVYWDMCEAGLLPRASVVTKVLMDSSDIDKMAHISLPLDAWASLKKELMLGRYMTEQEWANRITVGRFLTKCTFGIFCQRGILAALAFIHAHEEAKSAMSQYWGSRTSEEDAIEKEVEAQITKAQKFLDDMPPDLVATVKTKLLASDLLHFQIAELKTLMDTGVVTQEQAHDLKEKVAKDVHRNWEGWEDGWEDAWQ